MSPNPHTHKCAARCCSERIPLYLLMCGRHWRMVPKRIQRDIWRHYRSGQETDGQPITREYAQAARAAAKAVADQEHREREAERQGELFGGEARRANP